MGSKFHKSYLEKSKNLTSVSYKTVSYKNRMRVSRHHCVALIGTFKSYMDEVSMKVCNGSMAYGHQHITNFESQEHENLE